MTDEQSDYAPAWRPDKDDPKTVKGQVVDVVMGPDFGWGRYPIVTIRQQNGEDLAIHVQATILRSELAERRVGKGDDLEVAYLGKRAPKSGNGKPYHVYKVSGGKEPVFSWDNAAPAGRQEEDLGEPPIAPSEPFTPPASFQPQPAPTGEQFGSEPPF